jgi:hypothetical protein
MLKEVNLFGNWIVKSDAEIHGGFAEKSREKPLLIIRVFPIRVYKNQHYYRTVL